MPDLPAISLSQAHYDRVVAAFPGDTAAKKVAAYRAWTVNNLINFVETVEVQAARDAAAVQVTQKQAEILASLPPRLPFPPGGVPSPGPTGQGK